jgi:hypothetical protein
MRYLLAMAIGGLATYLVLKRQERPAATGGSRAYGADPTESESGFGNAMSDLEGESPNAAERLHDENVVVSPVQADMPAEDLFSSSSQRGESRSRPDCPT